ncbi:MAG: ATP-binding protein [Chloroflexi bacterium]|nr:ATP-binding protein [Chloroflexota bacterium]
MDVERPELSEGKLAMFCLEGRMTRELYWLGFGFQAWCQMLTHLARAAEASVIVIDEPDIYLHPDLQRRLLSMLREAGPDVVIATHSSEIVAEAEPSELVTMNQHDGSARRLKSPDMVKGALESIGSIHNLALTRLARSRHVLYVEGEDFRLIRQFARKKGHPKLALGTELTAFPLGGFPTIEKIRAVSHGIRETLGGPVLFAGVFDRDFRPEEHIGDVESSLAEVLSVGMIWKRKELENYLLIPSVLDRAMSRAATNRGTVRFDVSGAKIIVPPATEVLDTITSKIKSDLLAQYLGPRLQYFRSTGKDIATLSKETIDWFESQWSNIETRLQIVPGKVVFGKFIESIRQDFGLNLTKAQVVDAFTMVEFPDELSKCLSLLDNFLSMPVR